MTPRQKECLDFITDYIRENDGVSPSFDEIKDGLGLASKSGAHRLVSALEEMNFIVRSHGRARRIDVPGVSPERKDMLFVALRDAASRCFQRGYTLQQVRVAVGREYRRQRDTAP